VIDLGPALGGDPAERLRVGREIDRTYREIGFFTITGHGVPDGVMDELRNLAKAFFALPLEEKQRAVHPMKRTPRGYIALGVEVLSRGNAQATPPDLKEYYHSGRDSWPNEPYYASEEGWRYSIPNLWPKCLSGFAAAGAGPARRRRAYRLRAADHPERRECAGRTAGADPRWPLAGRGDGPPQLRENEMLARSVGIQVTHYLVVATVVSAGIAGAAGNLFAHYVRIVDPDVFLFIYTVTMAIMVTTGGKGALWGPVVGGLIFGIPPDLLRARRHRKRSGSSIASP